MIWFLFLITSACVCVAGGPGFGARSPAVLMNTFQELQPTQILACTAWYRAGSNITASSGSVSSWGDSSGNAHDIIENTSARRPVLRTGALNGCDALDFGVAAACDLTNRQIGTIYGPMSFILVFYITNGSVGSIFCNTSQKPKMLLSDASKPVLTLTDTSAPQLNWNIESNKWYCAVGVQSTNVTGRLMPLCQLFGDGKLRDMDLGTINIPFDNLLSLGGTASALDGMIAELAFFANYYLRTHERVGLELYMKKKFALEPPF